MSDPRQRARTTTPPSDPHEERELHAVAALLRGLPDPEPPEGLAERVMAEVTRREARPRLIPLLPRLPEPLAAMALAAGVAGLLLLGALQSGLLAQDPGPAAREIARAPLEPSVARRISTGADASAVRPRRRVVPSFASAAVVDPQVAAFASASGLDPQLAGFLGSPARDALASPLAAEPAPRANPLDARLDRQLNHLLLDPVPFYQRMERVSDPQRFLDRLAERAARRGDATEVALRLRLRAPEHPYTTRAVERFLRAALERHLAMR